jgi:hypothetical protein
VCGGGSDLALLSGSKLGEVAVIITLPGQLLVLVVTKELAATHILW